MNRRAVLQAFIAILAYRGWQVLHAQSVAVPRIGILDPSPTEDSQGRLRNLRAGLKNHGLEEGRDYVIEYRSAEGRFERLPALAAELAAMPARVIVARNTPGVLAARGATSRIPIVMADVGDPVGLGFVNTLSRPGGNITGPSNATLELLHKRLEALRETVPTLRRVAVLGNSADQNTQIQIAELNRAARALGIETRVFDARSEKQMSGALEQIAAWRPSAVLPLVNPIYRSTISPRLIGWSLQHRLPVMHAFREEVEAGALMAYAADLTDHYHRVANYVRRLLAGESAASLAVERPTRFELVVNLKSAKALDLRIPQSVLLRADRVIE